MPTRTHPVVVSIKTHYLHAYICQGSLLMQVCTSRSFGLPIGSWYRLHLCEKSCTLGSYPPIPPLSFAGVLLSVAIFFALSSKKPPHWTMQSILVPSAFIMAIVWLNIEATEVVSVLKALGLMLNIDTGSNSQLYSKLLHLTSKNTCVDLVRI